MKNRSLFILLPTIFLFSGCGSLFLSEQAQSRFTNGIYVTAEEKALREKVMEDKNDYGNRENTYYLSEGESYEERLRKFDSPVYIYNIDLNDLWYDSYWYRPAWYWGTGWYNPYWGGLYGSFWFGDPYWHWYGAPGWSWSWDWYWPSPWYHYSYYGWWRDPWWHGGGHWPHHYHSTRDIYYGRRDSSPSYNNRTHSFSRNGGSSYRRYGSAGGGYESYSTYPTGGAKSGSIYRRARTTATYNSGNSSSSRGEYRDNSKSQSQSQSRSTSYSRSSRNSGYNSSSSATRSSGSSYSTGRSSGGSYSGGASRSGGSSYRRR